MLNLPGYYSGVLCQYTLASAPFHAIPNGIFQSFPSRAQATGPPPLKKRISKYQAQKNR
ncbi:hypothetical protein [Methanosarcina sp. 1.H.A.2.2]|uniref:hypothetical protein n=1 Tax=Methanosarcina sp. 1.H.A.2.2 TaxID=1483601 RepID=UPI000AA390C4|nr:hypothetical protein [Methanosarcina sp. 1.H.A.2.2]